MYLFEIDLIIDETFRFFLQLSVEFFALSKSPNIVTRVHALHKYCTDKIAFSFMFLFRITVEAAESR